MKWDGKIQNPCQVLCRRQKMPADGASGTSRPKQLRLLLQPHSEATYPIQDEGSVATRELSRSIASHSPDGSAGALTASEPDFMRKLAT